MKFSNHFHPSKKWDFRLTKNDLYQYKRIFDAFDDDAAGYVSCKHLATMVRAAGINFTQDNLQTVLDENEWNIDTVIELSDFYILIAKMRRDLYTSYGTEFEDSSTAELRRSFCSLYTDVSGKKLEAQYLVPLSSFKKFMTSSGSHPLTDLQFEKFRASIPEYIYVESRTCFNSIDLYEFCIKSSILPDLRKLEEEHETNRLQFEAERMERRKSRTSAIIQAQSLLNDIESNSEKASNSDNHSKTPSTSTNQPDGWNAPSDIMKKMGHNVSTGLTRGVGFFATGVKTGMDASLNILSNVNDIGEQFLPEELVDMKHKLEQESKTAVNRGLKVGTDIAKGLNLNINMTESDASESSESEIVSVIARELNADDAKEERKHPRQFQDILNHSDSDEYYESDVHDDSSDASTDDGSYHRSYHNSDDHDQLIFDSNSVKVRKLPATHFTDKASTARSSPQQMSYDDYYMVDKFGNNLTFGEEIEIKRMGNLSTAEIEARLIQVKEKDMLPIDKRHKSSSSPTLIDDLQKTSTNGNLSISSKFKSIMDDKDEMDEDDNFLKTIITEGTNHIGKDRKKKLKFAQNDEENEC